MNLTYVDHIALESNNIAESVRWYISNFKCNVEYQDETWALLGFNNIQIALVTPGQHPPHFAIVDRNVVNMKDKKTHRDGIHYIYENDPDMNVIEKIDRKTK